MFQTFDAPAATSSSRARLIIIRGLMDRLGLDALLVPRTDAHQGEYIPPSAERLRWLTGFTGSAGTCVVTRTRALLVVDGRYVTQAQDQVDPRLFEIVQALETFEAEVVRWFSRYSRAGDTLGFDPRLHTIDQIGVITKELRKVGIKFKKTSKNLIDQAWGKDRPAHPASVIDVHELKFAGSSSQEKLAAVQSELKSAGDSALLVTQSDNVSWLFNIRGADIPHSPVVLAFAIVPAKGKAELYIQRKRLTSATRTEIEAVATIHPLTELGSRLRHLAAAASASNSCLRIDPKTAAYWFRGKCHKHLKSINLSNDPITALKAIKNPVEIDGARAAHRRDAVAMCRFLAWLDGRIRDHQVDEIQIARQLEAIRGESGLLRDISFDTIVGSGPNGAIIHYRVNESTNRVLRKGELILIDSGGQYRDGTTDVTRTIACGEPGPELKQRFTLVLKGYLAIAMSRFPKGTRGIDLDPLARAALWQMGLDYDHGTGHGVGSYLSVHEGPQSISRRGYTPLVPGMICSNEPGYYKPGHYGIRIESLCLIEGPTAIAGGDREMMSFDTLTLVPIDRRLVVTEALTASELMWLNTYHEKVHAIVGPELDAEEVVWLREATRPI